jgi:P27 family predicted phage terminase small subunit
MGKRGPAKTPTNLTVLRGNPGKRSINKDEPKPRPIAPKRPGWMNKDAKRIWKDLSKKLEPLGLLAEVDGLNFQNLCLSASMIKGLALFLEDKGMVMEIERTDKNGDYLSSYFQQRPEVAIMFKAMEMVNKLGAKFGLSPADRAGLGVKPKENRDEFEEFLDRGKKKA